jgi:signal peptidase II
MRYKYFLITALIFIIDHATKYAVRWRFDLGDGLEIIPGFLRLARVHNSGVAFGLFAKVESPYKPYILALMAVVAVVVIIAYGARMPSQRRLLQLALAVTLGGILGNFTDRLMHGFVVDFVELHLYEAYSWPTFNVADSAITIGIALLLIDTVKNPEPDESRKETETA